MDYRFGCWGCLVAKDFSLWLLGRSGCYGLQVWLLERSGCQGLQVMVARQVWLLWTGHGHDSSEFVCYLNFIPGIPFPMLQAFAHSSISAWDMPPQATLCTRLIITLVYYVTVHHYNHYSQFCFTLTLFIQGNVCNYLLFTLSLPASPSNLSCLCLAI